MVNFKQQQLPFFEDKFNKTFFYSVQYTNCAPLISSFPLCKAVLPTDLQIHICSWHISAIAW